MNQNLDNAAVAKYYLLRAFSENLKELSSMLTNIWRFEAIYVISLECDVKKNIKHSMTSECWSPNSLLVIFDSV